MSKIACTATDCRYNGDWCCTMASINVDGASATTPRGTGCGTYCKVENDYMKNFSATPNPYGEISIKCSAKRCIHNQNEDCRAQTIGIAGPGSSDSNETACVSFCSK